MDQVICPSCHTICLQDFFYCPHCGKNIKETPLTIGSQLGLYATSLLLPPFGLFPGVRYLFSKDSKRKIAGSVAIVLTFVSIIVSIWLLNGVFGQISTTLNSQLQQYQNLGY